MTSSAIEVWVDDDERLLLNRLYELQEKLDKEINFVQDEASAQFVTKADIQWLIDYILVNDKGE